MAVARKKGELNPGLAAAVHKLTDEDRRKGGRNAAPTRKRNNDIRRAVQQILKGTYKDDDGNEISGADKVAIAMFMIAVDTDNRNAVAAAKFLVDVTWQNKSPEEKKKIKAEIALLQAEYNKIISAENEKTDGIKIILERNNDNAGNQD